MEAAGLRSPFSEHLKKVFCIFVHKLGRLMLGSSEQSSRYKICLYLFKSKIFVGCVGVAVAVVAVAVAVAVVVVVNFTTEALRSVRKYEIGRKLICYFPVRRTKALLRFVLNFNSQ